MKTASEFNALRLRAKEQRDKIIAHAKAEYRANLVQIAELEQRLLGRIDPNRMELSAAVERVIPREAAFNVNDVMIALEALDPGRVWRRTSVARHVTKLRELGLVKRMKRATVNEPASYVRCEVAGEPDEGKPLRVILREVVKKPMFTAEVVQAVLNAGYKTTMIAEHLRTYIIRALREEGFTQDVGKGGKWVRGQHGGPPIAVPLENIAIAKKRWGQVAMPTPPKHSRSSE